VARITRRVACRRGPSRRLLAGHFPRTICARADAGGSAYILELEGELWSSLPGQKQTLGDSRKLQTRHAWLGMGPAFLSVRLGEHSIQPPKGICSPNTEKKGSLSPDAILVGWAVVGGGEIIGGLLPGGVQAFHRVLDSRSNFSPGGGRNYSFRPGSVNWEHGGLRAIEDLGRCEIGSPDHDVEVGAWGLRTEQQG